MNAQPRGLASHFATDDLNCMLQCLFACPEFRDIVFKFPRAYLQRKLEEEKSARGPDAESTVQVALELQKVFYQLQTSEQGPVSAVDFGQCLSWYHGYRRGHEGGYDMLPWLLESLKTALQGTSSQESLEQLFLGKLTNELEGEECKHCRSRDEQIYTIAIGAQQIASLEQGLARFCATELLEGYRCDPCGQKVNVKRRTFPSQLPPIFAIVLQRKALNYETFQVEPTFNMVTFPLELDMTPYMNLPQEVAAQKDLSRAYELFAVMSYQGAVGSIYLAYVKDIPRQGEDVPSWHCLYDNQVRPVTVDEVLQLAGGSPRQPAACLFFYRQKSLAAPQIPHMPVELLEMMQDKGKPNQ